MHLASNIRNQCQRASYYTLFIVIEAILTVVFLTVTLIWHGGPFNYLTLNPLTRFQDFFMHLGYASSPFGTNIYEYSDMACFPPLAYLMYAFLARIVGFQAEDPNDVQSHQYVGSNMLLFIVYNLICILLMVYAISLYIKERGVVHQVVFPTLLILSYPLTFSSVERGNTTFLVAVLLAIALSWRNDPSRVKRELAMILIAVCAGLKIYPALFGLLYLKEKKWLEAIRLMIYGAVLFFVPFVFFGGVAAMRTFFGIVFALYGTVMETSVNGFTLQIVEGIFGNNAPLFATIVQQAYLLFSLIAFFCAKNKRSEVLILCCLMTVYVSSGRMYTCVYLLPAMLVFFAEQDQQPIRFKKGAIPDMMAFAIFLITFSRPFLTGGYLFIYDAIIIISSLYNLVIIGAVIYRRIYQSLS